MVSWDKVGRPRIWQTATLLSCSFIVYFGGNLAFCLLPQAVGKIKLENSSNGAPGGLSRLSVQLLVVAQVMISRL